MSQHYHNFLMVSNKNVPLDIVVFSQKPSEKCQTKFFLHSSLSEKGDTNPGSPVKWGLKHQTRSDFEWSKAVWFSNGWDLFGCHLVLLCTDSVFVLVFKWSILIHSCSYSPDHSKKGFFKCSDFQWILNLKNQYLSPHCTIVI